jgi:hypothetical protein
LVPYRVSRWFIFKPKCHFGRFWRALEQKMLVCFWSFGKFYGNSVYISPFWYSVSRKIWQPFSLT